MGSPGIGVTKSQSTDSSPVVAGSGSYSNRLSAIVARATVLRAHRIEANGTLGDALATVTTTGDVLSRNADVKNRPVTALVTLPEPSLPHLRIVDYTFDQQVLVPTFKGDRVVYDRPPQFQDRE